MTTVVEMPLNAHPPTVDVEAFVPGNADQLEPPLDLPLLVHAESDELTTGCSLHVVHLSTRRGVELVRDARNAGVDVTCEVTAHHRLLNEDDAVRLGAVAKCAPPLRPPSEPAALWELLSDRSIGFVVSNHSPAPPELKREDDLLASWGGTGPTRNLD